MHKARRELLTKTIKENGWIRVRYKPKEGWRIECWDIVNQFKTIKSFIFAGIKEGLINKHD